VEIHEGATDVYYVVGGGGTVFVGATLANQRAAAPAKWRQLHRRRKKRSS